MRHVLFALALAAFSTTGAWADQGPRGHERPDTALRGPPTGPPPHAILVENADEIGIDADTVAEIEALAEARRPEAEALHEQLRDATPAERAALQEQLHALGRELMEDIFALLTEEQALASRQILPPTPGEGPGGGPPGERDCRSR